MRERLTFAFIVLTLAVLAVFVVVRGYGTSALVEAQERASVERSATTLSLLLGRTERRVSPRLLAGVIDHGERVEYVGPDGDRVQAERNMDGDVVDPDDPGADSHAGDGAGSGDLVETRAVAGGGTLTLTHSAEIVDQKIDEALLPLVLVSLGLGVVGALVGVLAARRLSSPFRELADIAAQIGRGQLDVTVPRYHVPEADAIGRVLRGSAHDLDSLGQRERHFAANASHELRTPLTALRLELEDLALSPKTPPDVVDALSSALGQLDRLSGSVAELLDSSRESRFDSVVDIDLAALLHDAVARWRTLASSRTLLDGFTSVFPVRLPAGSLLQVMDVLIGNAVTHGSGTISVSVVEREGYLEVLVADEGTRQDALRGAGHPVASGGGGLAQATRIAHALGGQLRLTEAEHTTFSLVLPRADVASVAS